MTAVQPDLLRALVREVVEEVLRDMLAGALGAGVGGPPPAYRPAPAYDPAPAYHPAQAYRPAPSHDGWAAAPTPAQAGAPVRRIERGAVTEAVVRDAARDGVRLLLGRRAVLTPLARDLSRTLGVDVERRPDAEER
jgi:pyruvate/2-oxoglutarate dehydrogenase complex dihydrolipoamide acyltransferase (E2) component